MTFSLSSSVAQAANRESSTTPTQAPLAGFWGDGGFWHVDDLSLSDAARVLVWAPREGSVSWTAPDDTTAPTYDADGWFGEPAVAFDDASLQRMRADSLAPVIAGNDLPITIVVDCVPTKVSETMITFSTSAASPYCRVHTSASGNPVVTRFDGSTAAATQSLPSVINGRQLLAFSCTGTQAQVFTDKKADTIKSLDSGTLAAITQVILGNFFRTTTGESFDGAIRAVGISSTALSEAQLVELYSHLYHGQKRIWFLGDSITSGIGSTGGGGLRELLSDEIAAQNYNVDLVGSLNTGNVWSRTRHDGNPGETIAQASAKVTSVIGAGLSVGVADLTLLMIGTNNMGFGVSYDGTTTPAAYADLLDQIQAADPNTQIVVTTIPPINSANFPTPATNQADFNGKLPAIWDTFDAANPTKTLIRWDADACLGSSWDSGDFDDDVHPNDTGYDELLNDATDGLLQAIESWLVSAGGGADPALYIPPNAIFAARSDNVTLSGTDATAWPDQSPSAGNATGVLSTAYPQIDTSTFGRPVIVGAASQGYFTLPAAIATAILGGDDLPFTIYGVTRSDNGDEICGFGGSTGGADPVLRVRHASSSRLQCNKAFNAGTTADRSVTTLTDNVWSAWCIRCNGTTIDTWIDSATVKTGAAGAFNVPDCTGAPTTGTILARPGTLSYAQHMGQLTICNAANSDAEVEAAMNNAIAWKSLIDP